MNDIKEMISSIRDGQIMNVNRIYRYLPDPASFAGYVLDEADYDILKIHSQFRSVLQNWNPRELIELDDSPPQIGDFPSLVDRQRIPLFSESAWEVLGPSLENVAEPLPMVTSSGVRLFLINVFQKFEDLCLDQCVVDRFSDGGIRFVREYSFKEGTLDQKLMLKLPPESGGDLLVTDLFRQLVDAHSLEGLRFVEVPQAK